MRLLIPVVVLCSAAVVLADPVPATPPDPSEPNIAMADRVRETCAGCHELTMLEGKHYTPEKWAEVTDQMITRGAPVLDGEYEAMVAYLAATYGPAGK